MKKLRISKVYIFLSIVGVILLIAFVYFNFYNNKRTLDFTQTAVRIRMDGNMTTYTDTSIRFNAIIRRETLFDIEVKVDNISCSIKKSIDLESNNDFIKCENLIDPNSYIYLYIGSNLEFIALYDDVNQVVYLDKRGLQNSEFANRLPLLLNP
ncbi:MAG: hypothetical protein HGB31_00910 [Erysipelotrichaceae bacterium]|nr:hypothetical protein [Erysipelotrichaceae bacterium]